MTDQPIEKYTGEVCRALEKLATTHKKDFQYIVLSNYFGTELKILGLSMGDQRTLFKNGYSFSQQNLEDQLTIYDAIWHNAEIYELRFQAVFFITRNCKKLDPMLVLKTIDNWMDSVDCWPHSDDLAKVTCIAGVKIPQQYKSTIRKWNTSTNAWKRRQSVVALVRERNAFTSAFSWEELEKLFVGLIDDKIYMVQKGLGWALRDTGRIYPEKLIAFLYAHAHALSAIAFSTATEKITSTTKADLKLLRKGKKKFQPKQK